VQVLEKMRIFFAYLLELGRELRIGRAFIKAHTAFFPTVLRTGVYFKRQFIHATS